MGRPVQTGPPDEAASEKGAPATSTDPVSMHLQGRQELDVERSRLLSPYDIFFSQNHIRPEFQDGRSIDSAVEFIGSRRFAPHDAKDLGVPQKTDWWLLLPPFPPIEVIQWRIKLREEDGCQVVDDNGNELYGDREWYSLDNRRLYCLQKAAAALYPKQVLVLVSIVHQEEGTCREFRKFRSVDRGRSIRLGHRDSPNLPRWCLRLEVLRALAPHTAQAVQVQFFSTQVGLEEEVLPAGSTLPRLSRPRRPDRDRQGWIRRARQKDSREQPDDSTGPPWGSHLANASLFVLVYASMRLLFAMWHHYNYR
ncbi:unnamed protein product [Symbiodinium pilosum]|uniref:Uncharacterized protein n=1 Tax=Symbiodinium pilosum TaxID=2952 RepID=A0A812SJ25_SYMPI|nr:unnamed protein product [Symbiodinium pilosum]